MYRFLTRPIWVLFALIVATVTYTFMSLGFWQLDRLAERRFENTISEQRANQEPVPIEAVLSVDDPIDQAGEEHSFRTVTMTGHFDAGHEVLVRSQTYDGTAGFHVLTPFVGDQDRALLVNQGWIPLTEDTPPFSAPDDADRTITVTLAASQTRSGFGPAEPDGVLQRINRVDIARLSEQMPYLLYPVYGIAYGEPDPSHLPIKIAFPEFNEGPHLVYAIQWFTFAATAVLGYGALVRSTAKKEAKSTRGRVGSGT
ncbi:MAG: SURF1 family protein [Acidimicrobiia bacterium]|nr:SURF1 family protein [Acidimicrobiia bacterium]MDH5421105.1 SURF1 family protein [Acidimicrobiia bacterium]MDH5503025.1 SURF1 family protein [Acidimicrobiia bacterium]